MINNSSSFSQDLLPMVCLDIGGTLTKLTFAAMADYPINCETHEDLQIVNGIDNYVIHFISHPNSIESLIMKLTQIGFIVDGKSKIENIYITGGGSFKFYDQISQFGNVTRINEFDALKLGFKLLDNLKHNKSYFTFVNQMEYLQLTSSIYPFILVNIGSGVSILKFDNEDEFTRISGTSLGGGMFLGLSHLFTGINDFDELLKMTKQGSNAATDILMDEVHLGFQSPARDKKNEKHVAVSMGKLSNSNINQSDLVKSLLYMTTYNISQIAFLHSKLHNIERVFFSGHFIRNHDETLQCITEAFSYFSKLDQQNRHSWYILDRILIIQIKQMSQLFSILKNIEITKPQSLLSHTFVLCGPSQSGKSTIITKLTSQQVQESSGLIYYQQKTNIIGYQATLQYFEVSGEAFKQLSTLPLNKQTYTQYSFVLVLDLSDNPHEILNVCNQELTAIKEQSEKKLQETLDVESFKQLEQKVYDNLQSHHDKNRIRPSYIPIIIVGWKYDQFTKNLDQESRKWITRGLRYLAHVNNCSLVFGSNQELSLVKQTLHQNVKPSAQIYQHDHLKQICIFNLQDSVENINLPPSGSNPLDGFNKIIKDQIVAVPNRQKKKAKNQITEEEWATYKEDKIDRLIKQYQFQSQNQKNEEQILI